MRRISFDPVAEIFDKTRGPPEHVRKLLLKALVTELRGYRAILDAGVGTGRFAKPLQEEGFDVVGVDISKKMISVARKKGVADLFRGDVCFLPFKGACFDATICNAVLHLIPEWKAALQEIRRVTKRVMVSTTHERENPMREAYNSLLEEHGYEMPRREKSLRDLSKLVTPSESIHVASYYVDLKESLAYLSQRVYSYQWKIPENINNEIMQEMKRRFRGKKSLQGMRLLIWNSDDLAAYLRELGSVNQ